VALGLLAIVSWLQIFLRSEHALELSTYTKPKFFIENAWIRRFNSSGALEHTLTADTVMGSKNGTSFSMTRPNVIHNSESRAVSITSADSGEMLQRDELDLRGNVTLSLTYPDDRPKVSAATTAAHINLKTGIVTSDQPTNFTRETMTARGVGFSYDNDEGRLMINSNVSLTFNSK
jgi:lipopolysaccharide export system protein LptC